MIELGRIQSLKIERIVSQGAYLSDGKVKDLPGDHEVLLPKKQLPPGKDTGDDVEVFIYRDSEDRLIATVNKPFITLDETARLRVRETGKIGTFLDMGLERDLLLPFAEQTYRPDNGSYVLVSMYVDKSGRLAATMKVYDHLLTDSPYKTDDEVKGIVYEVSKNFGAFVAVDDRYSALIPAKEFGGEVKPGDFITARVSKVHEDGKLDLSVRKKAYLQLDDDGAVIMDYLDSHDGRIGFNDKADPELIKERFHMSKAAFKRAVGHLMKNKKVKITDSDILKIR